MGPPSKSVASTPPSRGRCLLCRRSALSPTAQQKANTNIKSCATSLCTIFGLPDTHPFKVIYERAQYCESCLKEVQDADVTLGKLELMKQSLLRFQNRVYSKLGDNYFQIEDRENLNASYLDFEKGSEAIKGKKFSYDEIVKVVYEKLDKDCLKWERFSSEGKIDTGSLVSSKVEASSQTDASLVSSASNNVESQGSAAGTAATNNQTEDTRPQVIFPDIGDDSAWGCDDNGGDDGGSDFETAVDNSILEDPLNIEIGNSNRVEIDYGPEAVGMPFTRPPINFEEKIYCTIDPENCKRFFYDQYNLKVHIKSFHEGNPLPHECTICLRGFVDENRLKSHFLRIHTSIESFMCDQCGKGFASPAILRQHVRKSHNANGGGVNHTCTFCSAPFDSTEDLSLHEALHRTKELPFTCTFCDQSCPNSVALKSHYNLTHAQNKVTCELCGKVFGTERSLQNHMNVHTKAFICDQCGFAGTSKHSLKNHMMTHSTEKKFTCQHCGSAFKYAKNLSSHMRIHTGEKPYSCSVCGESFRELSYLRRHEESHSSKDNYQCAECGAGFKVKENLKKHERIHKEGYVPKKKKYKPRSEAQKLARQMKYELKREAGLLGPRVRRLPKSSSPDKSSVSPSKIKTVKKMPRSKTVKAEVRKKSKQRSSPMRKSTGKKSKKSSEKKVGKKSKKKLKREPSFNEEEEDNGDNYESEEEIEMQAIPFMDVEKQEEEEMANAVASIQQHQEVVLDNSLYSSNSIVYTSGYSTQHVPSQATIIPVTVVNTEGATTASQLVMRARAQQQPQQQHVAHYQLF